MSTAVIVPWAPQGDADRIAAWGFLRPRWPWPVFEGLCSSDNWVKAEAVRDGIDQLPDDVDVLIIADADVLPDFEIVGDAAFWLAGGRGRGWVVPHGQVRRLTAAATAGVIEGRTWPSEAPCIERHEGRAGGGVVVVRRDDYELAPLDPRFAGWGQEDDAWCLAMRTMLGRETRHRAPLFHLWHRPQERLNRRIGSQQGAALKRRYSAAAGRRERMAALLSEFRSPPA